MCLSAHGITVVDRGFSALVEWWCGFVSGDAVQAQATECLLLITQVPQPDGRSVQTLSKVLVIVVLVASLSFMGFAVAAYLGGPNWNAEMLELQGSGEFEGYQFHYSDVPPGKWTATRGRDNTAIGSSSLQPQVIVAALKASIQQQTAEMQAKSEAVQRLETQVGEWKNHQATDEAALEARRVELLKHYEATRAAASRLAAEVARKTEEARTIEQRIGERREDVIRLRTQLTELKTEQFRLQELKQELTDQLQQLLASLGRAEERNERLMETSNSTAAN